MTLATAPVEVPATTIHELVAHQAALRPDATAVVGGGERLSYAELQRRSDELAVRLRCAPEAVVAVCARREPHFVVAMLAVLKAGGACLPVDRAYPADRIAHMVADSGCVLALVDPQSRTLMPPGLDTVDVTELGPPAPQAPAVTLTSEQAAMVLYTSGSTGRPKGVVLSHRNVLTLITGDDLLRHRAGERVAHVLSSSFDAVLLDVWGALAAGATVWLASEQALRSVGHLYDEIADVDLTVLPLTSSLLHQLIQVRPEQARRIPRLWFGGEAAQTALVQQVAGPATQLVHHYGPTECTSIATVRLVGEADRGRPVIPIGRALSTIRLYLLDDALRPVAPGEVGQIHLGGPQVGRGYLGSPRLTADRFLPDPFAADGGRMYRTGDLGRTLPDGAVEFVGRVDNQVKIRGYRVEPAEVTAAIREVPGVTDAAVVAREDLVPNTRMLVAYLVGAATEEAVVRHLSRSLPEYMLPAVYVPVDAIPLLPNHKVDLAALPAPPRPQADGVPVAPADTVRDRLAALWCEILDRDSVRPGDNFFALGGYSLLAARLMARIEQTFHTRLPLRALFNARTLGDLAAVVERELAASAAETAPATTAAIAAPAQRELWFLHRLNPEGSDYNSPLAYRISGEVDLGALRRAVEEIVRRHDALRWTFHSDRGRCAVSVGDRAEVTPSVTDVATASATEIESWARQRRDAPFDLASWPLLRVDVLRVAEPRTTVLLITVHHIVFDGWSAGIFVDELGALYRAYRAGAPSPLPAMEHRYGEVVWREHQALESGELEPQLDHWRTALRGASATIDLPEGDPGLPEGPATGIVGTIDEALGARLRATAQARGRTPFVLLLSAFGLAVRALTGVDDLVVACPNAGRRGTAAASVIGLFAHMLPIRMTVRDDQRITEFVASVGDAVVGAFTNQTVPFDRIVQELRPVRRRGVRAPYTQLVFNLIDLTEAPLDLGGPAVEPLRVEAPETRVPMAVIVKADGAGYRVEILTDPRAVAPSFAEAVLAALPRAVELVTSPQDPRLVDAVSALHGTAPATEPAEES